MLELLRTPESILDWSASYLRILFIGALGLGFYNILSGVLRGLGDAVSALYYLIVSSVINIVLDILFVARFNMGVAGVALATVIAQAISAVLCINRLRKMSDVFDFGVKYFKWKGKYAGQIIKLGLPSGITQAIFSMSIVLVQSLTNTFGEQLITASVILQRVDGFAVLPIFSFGSALTTYAGQNIGAGNKERVEKGSRQGLFMSLLFSVLIVAVILTFGKNLMRIFTDTEELVELSMHLMRILAGGYLLMSIIQCLTGVMRGAGDTVTPMWISIIETFFLRMPLAYVMVYLTRSEQMPLGNRDMIYYSLLIAWGIGAIMSIVLYRFGGWRKKAVT